MNKQITRLFHKLPERPVPAGLSTAIMQKIERSEINRLRIRALIHGALVCAALVLCVPAIKYIGATVAQSGFGEYFSLVFSDSGLIVSHFQDFMLLIADALPVTGGIALVAIALIFVNSLVRMFQNISSLSAHRRYSA